MPTTPATASHRRAAPRDRRILFVLGAAYLPGSITGANISLHALCRKLVRAGFAPTVVCQADAPEAPMPSGAIAFEYPVLRLADPTAAMAEMIGALMPEAIVIRGIRTAVRAAAYKAVREFPARVYFVSNFVGQALPAPEGVPHWRYGANSPFLARIAAAYLGAPVACVPSLVEPSQYRCVPDGDAVLFLNPVADKGVHLAAEIARRLPRRRFLFVKSWPDEAGHPHAEVRLPNLEWAESTFDMRTIYRRARLLLVPSVWEESSSRAVTEAQFSGIPVVSSDRGGLAENVGAGGTIIPIGAPIGRWCEAVERLFTDHRAYARLSRAAKAHAGRPEIAPARVLRRLLSFIGAGDPRRR